MAPIFDNKPHVDPSFQRVATRRIVDDVDMTIDGPPDDIHGDGKLDENIDANFIFETPDNKLSAGSSMYSDSFESVTSTALQTTRLQLSTTNADDDNMAAALSPVRGTTPLHDPEPTLKLAPVPFGSAGCCTY
ncbi:hypothetical protein HanRHA438_Chr14g0637151 [Helianthus annuus]|nr:hypothetical protein HanRHA438_Chr14g0637151 [Helianthus annuus]